MPYHATCVLMGHITADVELRTAGESQFVKFSLAVDTSAKIDGAWGKRTTFWRCTAWGKDAEWLARDARKGSLVLVEGEPYSEDYTKDGEKKTSPHHVRCSAAKCLDRKERGSTDPAPAPTAAAPIRAAAPATQADADGEPPF